MYHYLLLITFSWIGSVSLQYIKDSGLEDESVLQSLDPLRYNAPSMKFSNLPIPRNDYEMIQNEPSNADYSQFYHREDGEQGSLQRKRRTAGEENRIDAQERPWLPNLIDVDRTTYIQNNHKTDGNPFLIQGFAGMLDTNSSDINLMNPEKRSFSPWGGKRDKTTFEHMWTWKRAANIREPSMPKRVRFSPWGGKRSGQLIYKPGSKGSKIILSQAQPDLSHIFSNSQKGRVNLAGFHVIPSMDKRHPIRVLTLSTKYDPRPNREAMPFKEFLDSLPKFYKPGHLYADVNLKKDGKRKVKFSAWGGKRSPPIIGPIWTPSPQSIRDTTLDAIILIRNGQDMEKTTKQM